VEVSAINAGRCGVKSGNCSNLTQVDQLIPFKLIPFFIPVELQRVCIMSHTICYFDITIGNEQAGRLTFELFDDIVPKVSQSPLYTDCHHTLLGRVGVMRKS
jgi:hypothetical protein